MSEKEERLKFLQDAIDEIDEIVVNMKNNNYPEEKIKHFQSQQFAMYNELYNIRAGRRNE
tara:strand:- start:289 stop:468 length:180 start_codon:yes stop_codon:yes gene_type:complete